MEECLIPHELEKLSSYDVRFLVHLDDIKDGKLEGCPESMYENIATIFESSPMRTFFIVGLSVIMNGWTVVMRKKSMRVSHIGRNI